MFTKAFIFSLLSTTAFGIIDDECPEGQARRVESLDAPCETITCELCLGREDFTTCQRHCPSIEDICFFCASSGDPASFCGDISCPTNPFGKRCQRGAPDYYGYCPEDYCSDGRTLKNSQGYCREDYCQDGRSLKQYGCNPYGQYQNPYQKGYPQITQQGLYNTCHNLAYIAATISDGSIDLNDAKTIKQILSQDAILIHYAIELILNPQHELVEACMGLFEVIGYPRGQIPRGTIPRGNPGGVGPVGFTGAFPNVNPNGPIVELGPNEQFLSPTVRLDRI